MSVHEIRLDEESGLDSLIHTPTGTKLMLNRLGAELIGYRIVDPMREREVPLMYRDSEPEKPASGWKNHATVLFPIVGGLKNNTSTLGDRVIRTPGNHGIARHSVFRLVGADCERGFIHYRLSANDYTREYYPVDFHLDLIFALQGRRLVVTFEISNPSSEVIHYCFGWHPGFRTPIVPGKGRKTDCRLVMPQTKIRKYHNNEHCRLIGHTSMMAVGGPLDWTEEGLESTLMLEIDDPSSRTVTLDDPNSGIGVRIDFPEFPHLGFWSEPGDEFICIEPWQGMDDHEDQESFDCKVGIVSLEAGGSDRRIITVTPLLEQYEQEIE